MEQKQSTIDPEDHLKSMTDSSYSLTQPTLTPEEEKRAWRKIDIRLVPILTLLYLFSSIDRGNIGLAKIQGMTEQLELTGNRFNVALTMFFLPFCLFEFPSNLVLKKVRPSRWLPAMTVTWGAVMISMGFVKTYQQLVAVRVCLGVAEAGMFPGIAYYLTLWYPRHKLQFRLGLFFGASTVSGAFSGLLGYAISFMSGAAGMLGWSWIFIIEGSATVVVGILAYIVMVDLPSTAKFLTPQEKNYVMWEKKYEASSIGEEEHFEIRHIYMAVADWQVWAQLLFSCSICPLLYGISFFLPSIIKGFGYSIAISNLLTIPPYVVATFFLVMNAHFSDKLRLRWPFLLAGLITCGIGFIINISSASIGVKYFGTFLCVAGSYSCIPGIVAWLSGNVAGQYKRSVALAILVGFGNLPGIVASNIYRANDAPRYKRGHAIELGFVGLGIVVLLSMVFTYHRINARREEIMREAESSGGLKYTDDELRKMGDKAPNYRYGV